MNVRKTVLKSFLVPLVSVLALSVSACGEDKASQDAQAQAVPHSIKVGVVPGPYREMLDLYLKPVVQKKGHDLKFVEFTDWVQPDSALASGDIDANVFQHQSYLNGIVENQGLKLSSVVNVPTLGIFAFSDKYKSFEEVQDGATVGIPNDPVNLARALRVARDLKVIGLDPNKDEQKASLADIKDNPNYQSEYHIPVNLLTETDDKFTKNSKDGFSEIQQNINFKCATDNSDLFIGNFVQNEDDYECVVKIRDKKYEALSNKPKNIRLRLIAESTSPSNPKNKYSSISK